ncbi:MAG: hypothetical protein IT532_09890 [Burkholderiales bacterium]|nr:hypothetical protein [Burkholderiales bacterium]
MNISAANRSVLTSMHRVLEQLCDGDWSAVRVACVPNGIEYRFLACVAEGRRPDVYGFLAVHTDMPIPVDGGPLNLSEEQAIELGQLDPAKALAAAAAPRARRAATRKSGGRSEAALG